MTRKSEDDAARKSDNVTHVVEVMSILDINIQEITFWRLPMITFASQIKSGEVEAGLNELLEKVRIEKNFLSGIPQRDPGEGGLRRRGESESEEEEQEQSV